MTLRSILHTNVSVLRNTNIEHTFIFVELKKRVFEIGFVQKCRK